VVAADEYIESGEPFMLPLSTVSGNRLPDGAYAVSLACVSRAAQAPSLDISAAIKTVAEWFPKKDRAFVTGLFNTGSTVGVIIGPLLIPYLSVTFGWQTAFLVTGALGFIWLFFWLSSRFIRHGKSIGRLRHRVDEFCRSGWRDCFCAGGGLDLAGHRQLFHHFRYCLHGLYAGLAFPEDIRAQDRTFGFIVNSIIKQKLQLR
jgi:MFS family permease